jgi:cyclophilin family peptidyl-prolyl cis-trans isomerase
VAIATSARRAAQVDPLARGWITCLALAARGPLTARHVHELAGCGDGALGDHLRLPLVAELVTAGVGDAAFRRAALRVLLAHDDPRVRAAGIGALAATWQQADGPARESIVRTIGSALAAQSPIVAGAAVEAAPGMYERIGDDPALRSALDAAIVERATRERDVELAAALRGVIGARKLAAGLDACRAGLAGHVVVARAAAACVRELGDGAPAPVIGPDEPPPVDVAAVIGTRPRWRLETSRGEIVIELRPDLAPWAVASIVALTRRGFYAGLELHRVVPGFVAQGGDPTMSGWGGPGYDLPAEPSTGPGYLAGGVGIADAGRDSGGSQWFVMHARAPHLDGRYTYIGSVVSGHKSADALVIGDRVVRATIDP